MSLGEQVRVDEVAFCQKCDLLGFYNSTTSQHQMLMGEPTSYLRANSSLLKRRLPKAVGLISAWGMRQPQVKIFCDSLAGEAISDRLFLADQRFRML